jgi:hypothetical protein
MKTYFQIVIIVLLANIFICIKNPILSWLIILALDITTLIIWAIKKPKFYNETWSHQFAPLSSACSGLAIGGTLIALVGIYNYYWIGFLWAIINFIVMSFLSRKINPQIVYY